MAVVYLVAYEKSEGHSSAAHYPLSAAEGHDGRPRWFNTKEEAETWARDAFMILDQIQIFVVKVTYEATYEAVCE